MKRSSRKPSQRIGKSIFPVLFAVSVSGFLLLSTGFSRQPGSRKPNIIVILIDDAGYVDFGFMGSKDLPTPQLDALAARSVRFTNAYVTASVCSPSRAGLLTGRYQQRFGYECNEGAGYTGIDTTQTLLASVLRESGYKTAAFGKWHLGFEPAQHPLQQGFDYYYGFLSGGRSYFYHPAKDDRQGDRNALEENGKPVRFEGYLTDVLGDKAAGFIRQNKEHPFFLYWAPNAVHTPMEATTEDLKLFEKHPRQKLAAMTYALDRSIGRIITELKQQGIYDNTLLFFLSDNGGAYNNQSSNGPLKGFKGNKYEGGLKVPFLVSWPGKFRGGADFGGLTSSLDVFATALDAAGLPRKPRSLDGVSLLPFLTKPRADAPHAELAWRKDAEAAIRFNQYKMIRVRGLGERLYDLETDPQEQNDLRFQKPETFGLLARKLEQWEKDKTVPRWTEGATWDTITLMIHDDLMNNRRIRVTNPGELEQLRTQHQLPKSQKISHDIE
ncbi:sulfatase-like hydrolase/transferase [Flaviaesturariibacter amylovorans]|uniref:Sulfatase N-terminal domain-containing protein n=1 Tax=Flaviaesturariibacter amylovorans TaxID=1084520 RepID=A0ABP8GRE5_9BACT